MHTVQALVLEFSQLWQVAGVTKTLAQNWTNGRPLYVLPSIATASGKGTRNLYSIYDAYLLAYLNSIRERGISTDMLERITDILTIRTTSDPRPLEKHFSRKKKWLAISVTKLAIATLGIQKIDESDDRFLTDGLQLSDFHDDIGIIIAVNIARLMDRVDARAKQIIRSRRASS